MSKPRIKEDGTPNRCLRKRRERMKKSKIIINISRGVPVPGVHKIKRRK